MKEFIDKLISRLEEEKREVVAGNVIWAYSKAISIINKLAEEFSENTPQKSATISKMETVGWIPCSERLPEVDGRYLCSYHYKDGGRNYVQVLSYYAYDEKPHFQHEGYEGLEVEAWCELPAPYTEGE